MSRRLALAFGLLLAVGGAAHAQQGGLTVAIFAPNAPFDSGDARYSFAAKLASQIQSATGTPTEPKAYARASDFEAAVKKNLVDFAVVDAVYLAERGVPYPVLAAATTGGEPSARWALYSTESGAVADLQGKRLALAATGPKDNQFIDNALLDSELPKHFGARQTTPDIASAVSAVALHHAQCVFAPEGTAKGLRKVYDAGRVPNPALVQIKSTLAADLVAKVRQAAVATGASGPYDGWRAATTDAYRSLASRLGPKVRRPVMSEPDVVRLDDGAVLVPSSMTPTLTDPRDQYWTPTGAP